MKCLIKFFDVSRNFMLIYNIKYGEYIFDNLIDCCLIMFGNL